MANWDIFHTDRLELESDLSPEAVREGIASGRIRPDDLARPSGTGEPWGRIDSRQDLFRPSPPPPPGGAGEEPIGEDAGTFAPIVPGAGPPERSDRATETIAAPIDSEPPPREPDRIATPLDDDDQGPPSGIDLDDDGLAELHLSGDHAAQEPEPPTIEAPTGWSPSSFGAADEDDFDDAIDARFAGIDDDEDEDDDEFESLDRNQANRILDAEDEPTVELRRPPRAQDPDRDDWDDLIAAAGGSMPPPGLTEPGALPVAEEDAGAFPPLDEPEAFDPLDEDEEAAAFTLAADPAAEPDEIDLTAMVDVAFQLVLFFLVTATTVYFKTLEIPAPKPEEQEAVAQQMRTLDELLEEYILVEIDPQGRVQVDGEPVAPEELAGQLRQVRSDTLRTGMLLMADFTTPHRNAVLAVDSANAVGLEIAIARPSAPDE